MSHFNEVVKKLETKNIFPSRAPSIEPTKIALKKTGLSSLIDEKKVIVVAGTNGKGSVCATLEALLLSSGKRVGLYTSPHLVKTTERFRIDGLDVSEDLFLKAFHAIENISTELDLSHFEVLTIMAAWIYFSGAAGVFDYVIFEVGLGGTWDSTNAIPHKNCIISVLGMDHENLLGNDLESIAKNKFGIVTNNSLVVHAPLDTQIKALAQTVKKETNSRWIESIPFSSSNKIEKGEPKFYIHCEYSQNEPVPLNLPGHRGAANTALALTAFKALGFDPSKHMHALSNVRWDGRMEKLQIQNAPCPVYASGDHNPQGVVSLLEILKHYPRKNLHAVVGIGKDKNADSILDMLCSLPDTQLYLTETPFKGLTLAQYGAWLQRAIYANEKPEEALRAALRAASAGDLILVTGSLYLVGEIKKLF